MIVEKVSSDNSFMKLREQKSGQVSVKLQRNNLKSADAENYYGRVNRVLYSNQNVLDKMADKLPDVTIGKITDVMTVYTQVVLDILKAGGAVRFGSLGTFYIASKGTTESQTGKTDLTVKFSCDENLCKAVDDVEIADSQFVEAKCLIDAITDLSRNECDGTFKAGVSVIIEGSGLRVAGDDSGIWCAPMEGAKLNTDESTWTKTNGNFFYNTPTKLLFTMPESMLPGKYCFILRTRCSGYSKHERKGLIETVSASFELVA